MATSISPILPNGYIGSASQSAAVRNLIASTQKKAKRNSKKKKTKGPSKAKASKRANKRKKTKGPTKLKAGSAAAKAWGAKMKRLRKKKSK